MNPIPLLLAVYLRAHGVSIVVPQGPNYIQNVKWIHHNDGTSEVSYSSYLDKDMHVTIHVPAPKDYTWRVLKETLLSEFRTFIKGYSDTDVNIWIERIKNPSDDDLLEMLNTKNGEIFPGLSTSWYDFYHKTQHDRLQTLWGRFWSDITIEKFLEIEYKLHDFLNKSPYRDVYINTLYQKGVHILSHINSCKKLRTWVNIEQIPDGTTIYIREPIHMSSFASEEGRLTMKWIKPGPEFLNLYALLDESKADTLLKKYTSFISYVRQYILDVNILDILMRHPELLTYLIQKENPKIIVKTLVNTIAVHYRTDAVWKFAEYLLPVDKVQLLRDKILLEAEIVGFDKLSVKERYLCVEKHLKEESPEQRPGECELFLC